MTAESQSAMNEAMRLLGKEGLLCAGFVMKDGELEAVFDNVPGGLKTQSLRDLLYQIREALKPTSGVEIKEVELNNQNNQEMN